MKIKTNAIKLSLVISFLLNLFLFSPFDGNSQEGYCGISTHPAVLASIKDFNKKVLFKKFKQLGSFKDVYGDTIYIDSIQKPIVLLTGFSGCGGCKLEKPLIFQLAESYPSVQFMYMTFDSKDEVLFENKKSELSYVNIIFISINEATFRKLALCPVFPYLYFIGSNKIVQAVSCGSCSNRYGKAEAINYYKYLIEKYLIN